jgi:hypothetical protein
MSDRMDKERLNRVKNYILKAEKIKEENQRKNPPPNEENDLLLQEIANMRLAFYVLLSEAKLCDSKFYDIARDIYKELGAKDEWDIQIEENVRQGRLDDLIEQARKEYDRGNSKLLSDLRDQNEKGY